MGCSKSRLYQSVMIKRHGCTLTDVSMSSSGGIALSGFRENEKTFIAIYKSQSEASYTPLIYYESEYIDNHPRRVVSFLYPHADMIVTGNGEAIEIFNICSSEPEELISCGQKLMGERITCLDVKNEEIFIGLVWSKTVVILDKNLDKKKTIHFQRFVGCEITNGNAQQKKDYLRDIAILKDELVVCESKKSKRFDCVVSFGRENGETVTHYKKKSSLLTQFRSESRAYSIAACEELKLLVVVWNEKKLVVYHIDERKPLSSVLVKKGVSVVRISAWNKRIVTGNSKTGEIACFDMGRIITYSLMKDYLTSNFPRIDFVRLLQSLSIEGDRYTHIMSNDEKKRLSSLLDTFEEDGLLPQHAVGRIKDALQNIHLSCYHVVALYHAARRYDTKAITNKPRPQRTGEYEAHQTESMTPSTSQPLDEPRKGNGVEQRNTAKTLNLSIKTASMTSSTTSQLDGSTCASFSDSETQHLKGKGKGKGTKTTRNSSVQDASTTSSTLVQPEEATPASFSLDQPPAINDGNYRNAELSNFCNERPASTPLQPKEAMRELNKDLVTPSQAGQREQFRMTPILTNNGNQKTFRTSSTIPQSDGATTAFLQDHCNKSRNGQDKQNDTKGDVVTDIWFQDLSAEIGKEWKEIGRRLLLSSKYLQHIEKDNEGNSKEAYYEMLVKWKEINGNNATYEALAKALKEAERKDLADKISAAC